MPYKALEKIEQTAGSLKTPAHVLIGRADHAPCGGFLVRDDLRPRVLENHLNNDILPISSKLCGGNHLL
jgi:hypothetical protein